VVFSLYQDTPSVVTVAEEDGFYVINTSSDMKKYAPTKSFHPYDGPVTAQDGSEKVAAGATLDDGSLLGIDWLVQGVETQLPN